MQYVFYYFLAVALTPVAICLGTMLASKLIAILSSYKDKNAFSRD